MPTRTTSVPAIPPSHDRVPHWLLDALLGLAVALVVAIVITADQGGRQDPDALAYFVAMLLGALMLVRRRHPVTVLVATMGIIFGYYALDYPAIGLAVPVAAALYSTAELGHLRAAVVVSIILVVVSTYARVAEGQSVSYVVGYELVSTIALMAAAIALGDSTRSRRALRAEQAQSTHLIAQEHARRAEQRIQHERIRIARDLHDLIGHTISVIALHAAVADEAVGNDDVGARHALQQIRTVTSATMRELRATVKFLRSPDQVTPDQSTPERSVVSLANLPALIAGTRASGLTVAVNVNGRACADEDLSALLAMTSLLPATVDMAAYRIVQESLTNVLRHAQATHVSVTFDLDADALRLRIHDNGASSQVPISAGSGITGMRERARQLGGTLLATSGARGFTVEASLPIERALVQEEG